VARKKSKAKEEALFWFLVCNYVAWALCLLEPQKEDLLDGADKPGQPGWKEHVETQLQIDQNFLRRVYDLCTERMSLEKSFVFILRGLGDPNAAETFLKFMS
jgi:hypothetical protein